MQSNTRPWHPTSRDPQVPNNTHIWILAYQTIHVSAYSSTCQNLQQLITRVQKSPTPVEFCFQKIPVRMSSFNSEKNWIKSLQKSGNMFSISRSSLGLYQATLFSRWRQRAPAQVGWPGPSYEQMWRVSTKVNKM